MIWACRYRSLQRSQVQGLPGQLATLTLVDRPGSSLRRPHRTRFRARGEASASAAAPDPGRPTGAVSVGFCCCFLRCASKFYLLSFYYYNLSILIPPRLPLRREPHPPYTLPRLHALPKPVRSVTVSVLPPLQLEREELPGHFSSHRYGNAIFHTAL